jgi:hypothetical protein
MAAWWIKIDSMRPDAWQDWSRLGQIEKWQIPGGFGRFSTNLSTGSCTDSVDNSMSTVNGMLASIRPPHDR